MGYYIWRRLLNAMVAGRATTPYRVSHVHSARRADRHDRALPAAEASGRVARVGSAWMGRVQLRLPLGDRLPISACDRQPGTQRLTQ
jgi:hypothetical protein